MAIDKKPYNQAEYMKGYLKTWRAKNRERVREINRKSYHKNRYSPAIIRARRKYVSLNAEKIRTRNRVIQLKAHGLTPEKFNEMLSTQGGVCAICKKPQVHGRWKNQNLAIDHNHRCCGGLKGCEKCVRGLLCNRCNQAIGLLEDSAELLQSAADYLSKY